MWYVCIFCHIVHQKSFRWQNGFDDFGHMHPTQGFLKYVSNWILHEICDNRKVLNMQNSLMVFICRNFNVWLSLSILSIVDWVCLIFPWLSLQVWILYVHPVILWNLVTKFEKKKHANRMFFIKKSLCGVWGWIFLRFE